MPPEPAQQQQPQRQPELAVPAPGEMPPEHVPPHGAPPGWDELAAPERWARVGRVAATPGARAALSAAGLTPVDLLRQHALEGAEREQHARNLSGARRLFAYRLPQTDERVWLITEAGHAGATLLLPGEYRPGTNP